MGIIFKQSISSPCAVDIGNQSTQGRIVSKTVQFGLFTTNANAVWAAKQQLQKESYPFAFITLSLNRNMFKLQVGDVFKYSYAKHGISNMICRVLQIEEENLESEKIKVYCMEDVFSVNNSITDYTDPVNNSNPAPDYSITPFGSTHQGILIAPFVITEGLVLGVTPLAGTPNPLILGLDVYMSIDGGTSYSFLGRAPSVQPFGTLNSIYPVTSSLDESTSGIVVDFIAGSSTIETVAMADVLAGTKNRAMIDNEYISFQSITPITSTQFRLNNIVRGRYGSEIASHSSGATIWFLGSNMTLLTSPEISEGATRHFKYVPYNHKISGSITDAIPIALTVSDKAKAPYRPSNFNANGSSFESLYTTGEDIVLTWSPRKRGTGAGIGNPGVVLADSTREGLFQIRVLVNSIVVRTVTNIDADTWTYTNVMNLADNISEPANITFQLLNFIVNSGYTYSSEEASVTCTKN